MRNLVPFLWNKSNTFTFILTNSIKAADLHKSIRSGSYLTTRHRPLSFLKWCKLVIFQQSPMYSSVSFNQALSSIQTLGGYVFLSFNCSPLSPSPYLSIEKGQAPAIPHQIKLRIINHYGRAENQERLTQICLDSPGRQMSISGLCWNQSSSFL